MGKKHPLQTKQIISGIPEENLMTGETLAWAHSSIQVQPMELRR
jgi:hypothetical protein